METQDQEYPTHTCSRWLWYQVHKMEDLDHLIKSLKQYYDLTVDLDSKEYVKIELDWDYK